MAQELKTYSFTDEDINLITFAVRRLSETTDYLAIKEDTANLLDYIERIKKEFVQHDNKQKMGNAQ